MRYKEPVIIRPPVPNHKDMAGGSKENHDAIMKVIEDKDYRYDVLVLGDDELLQEIYVHCMGYVYPKLASIHTLSGFYVDKDVDLCIELLEDGMPEYKLVK